MLTLPVLALIVEEAVEVLDPGVVKFAGHFNQQQVDPWYLMWLLAKAVDSDALVPTKYIDGQVTLLLHFGDLRDGRGDQSLESSDHLRWGTILVSLGDVMAVDMPEPLGAPIEDSGQPCFSR